MSFVVWHHVSVQGKLIRWPHTSSTYSAPSCHFHSLSICCSLRFQHAGKACPNCLILWQPTLVNTLRKGFEKERRLFLINFCWDSLTLCCVSWTCQCGKLKYGWTSPLSPLTINMSPPLSRALSLCSDSLFGHLDSAQFLWHPPPILLPPHFPLNTE